MSARNPPPSRLPAPSGAVTQRASTPKPRLAKSKPASSPIAATTPKGSPKEAAPQTPKKPKPTPISPLSLSSTSLKKEEDSSIKEAQSGGGANEEPQTEEEQKQAQLQALGLGPKEAMPLRRRLLWAGLVVLISAIAAVIAVLVLGQEEAAPEPVSENRAPMPGETFAEDIEPVLAPAPDVDDWVAFGDTEVPMVDIGAYGGSLDVPDPSLSGLYTGLAEPGAEQGAAMVAAHVDTNDGDPAAFWPLHQAQEGEVITVHRNGVDYEYEIIGTEIHEQDALPAELFDPAGDHRLYLMTCAGEAVDSDGPWRYKYNLVVEATPISS